MRRWSQHLLWGLSLLVFYYGARSIGAGGTDDSHITFFAADRLANTGHLVNYNGEAVEQSSSLTLVALLALLHLVSGVHIPTLAYAVGLAGGLAAIGATGAIAERMQPGTGGLAALLAASSWCLVYWSVSGMETSLVAASTPLLVLLTHQAIDDGGRRLLLGLGAFALGFAGLRPENLFIVPGLAVVTLLWARWRRAEPPWKVATTLVSPVLLLTGFRWLHSGHALPQPARAKGGFVWQEGLAYLQEHATQTNLALLVATVVGLVLVVRKLRRDEASQLLVLGAATVSAQLTFVLFSGGDWMRHGRFIVPAIPLMVAISASVLSRPREPGPGLVILSLLGLLQLRTMATEQQERLLSLREARVVRSAYTELARFSVVELAGAAHLRDAPVVIALEHWIDRLKARTNEPLLLASGQAGMVPYYAVLHDPDRVRFLDLFSLTSPRVMECAPEHLWAPSHYGRRLSMATVLRGDLDAGCGASIRPHIVFSNSLKPKSQTILRDAGYRVVFQHLGKPEHVTLPKTAVYRGFIAVRDELLLPAEKHRVFYRWRADQPVLAPAPPSRPKPQPTHPASTQPRTPAALERSD